MQIVFKKVHLRLFDHLSIHLFQVTEESNGLNGNVGTRHDFTELLRFFHLDDEGREALEDVVGQELTQDIGAIAEIVRQKKSDFRFEGGPPIFSNGYFIGGRGSSSAHLPSFAHAFVYLGGLVENNRMEPERAVALLQHLLSLDHPIQVDVKQETFPFFTTSTDRLTHQPR